MYLSDDLIRQTYFYCENKDSEGCYASDLDILEFGKKLEAVLVPLVQKAEHERCVSIVTALNREVGNALSSQKP